ncbi:MAG: sulfatase [Beijerinckiaceae bacterium]
MRGPNILIITSDQHRFDCFGHMGRSIKTPHFDRLAASGTRFDAAITPNVVCQPARASILTGLLPLTHGVYDNQVSLDPAIGEAGWAGVLSKSGYDTAFIGKAHFGEDPRATPLGAPESRPGSAHFPPGWNGPYMGFQHTEMMILGHWHELLPCEKPPRGLMFEEWFWSHPGAWDLWKRDLGPSTQGAAQTWYSALPDAWHSTTWVTDRTRSYIESHAQADRPFVLWASYPDPHHPFDCPEPWSRLHRAQDVDISHTHKRDLDRRPWWHEASITNEPAAKNETMRILRTEYSRIGPQSDAQLAEMTANYYNMIAFIDHGVGRIMDGLQQNGLLDNTIVLFTVDHGELLGDHGLYLKGPTHYEGLLRTPLVVAGPGVAGGAIVREPVSTLDIAPSLYDWAGVSPPGELQGRSIRPLAEGRNETRDCALNEWSLQPSRTGVGLELRTVRTANAKLTLDLTSGAGEMYHLGNDPDEMDNLFGDTGYAALQRELTDMIRARPGGYLENLAPQVPDVD